MRRHRGQRGQALALVLVVMAILFALVGALTIGVSELLRLQGGDRTASTDDLTVQSAMADTVSNVAGSQSRCQVTPATMVRSNQQPASPVRLSFPNGAGDPETTTWNSPSALCSRLDRVAGSLGAGTFSYLPLSWGSSNCLVQQVANGDAKTWIAFNGRWQTQDKAQGYAYVDGLSTNPCVSVPPNQGQNQCSTNPKACIRCGQTLGPFANPTVVQVALECDTSGTAPLYLHLFNPLHSPLRAFRVPESTSTSGTGVLYLFAAPTTLRTPSDIEDALLYVGPGGTPNQLVYEAPLP
jgi:hypothetical protein